MQQINQTEQELSVVQSSFWVIPSFNEGSLLLEVLHSLITEGVPNNRIVVVDDGSTKGLLVEDLGAIPNGVVILRHLVNLGQGAALQTGIDYARMNGAEFIVSFDADGQHQYQDAENMLKRLQEQPELDCVVGSRFLGATQDMPVSRAWTLKIGILFTRFMTGYRFSDVHNGLRVFRKRFFDNFRFHENRMEHASEILEHLARTPQNFEEFPVTISYSAYSLEKGQSSLNGVKIALRSIMSKFVQ